MTLNAHFLRSRYRWLLLLVFLLAYGLMMSSALQKSAMVDEQSHLFRGVAYLREGAIHFLLGHPLGASALSAFPLLTEPELNLPVDSFAWDAGDWSVAGDLFMWRLGNNPHRLLFLGRLPVIWLSLLLLALVFRWGRELVGVVGAFLAVGLLAFDPNFLANGRIISGDIPLTLFFVLTIFGYWRWAARDGGWQSLLVAGVGLGLASISKFNASLLLPILGLLGFFLAVRRRSWQPLLVLFWIGAIGSLVIWAGNGFAIRPFPGGPFWEDLLWELQYFGKAHGSYLLGEYSITGWWYYFPFAFLVKTPLPTLGLLAAGFGVLIWVLWRQKSKSGTEWGTAVLFLLLPVFVYFGVSLTSSLNIGYRYLLPTLPFLWLFTAVSLQNLVNPWQKRAHLFGGAAVLWLAIQALVIWPNYIPFFNLTAGGSDQSWRLLSDSNIDWGQDLPALAAWQQQTGQTVNLSYFGTAHPSAYNIDFVPMPMWPPAPEAARPGRQLYDAQQPAPGIYALSVTSLHGVVLGEQRDAFAWFRNQPPLARLGGSLFLYEVLPTTEPIDLVLFGVEPTNLSPAIRHVLGSNDVRVRWLNDGDAIVWPDDGGYLILGEGQELGEAIRPFLAEEPLLQSDNQQLFQLLPPTAVSTTSTQNFEDILALEATTFLEIDAAQSNFVRIVSQWQVLAKTERPLKLFVHALSTSGEIMGQWDGLSADPASWREGDQIVQVHELAWPAGESPSQFLIGVYDGNSLERLGDPLRLPVQ